MSYTYRGVGCLKSPIDLAIYLRLLWEARPRTIIEIGSKHGGSALLFRDIASAFNLQASIVSIDLNPPHLIADGISFVRGDVLDLEMTFRQHRLYDLPRPWLVIEDSAHTYGGCMSALRFFGGALTPGEYLVLEDGILSELGLADSYAGGPNRALEQYLSEFPEMFEITPYCDLFGPNLTYNPNGYLRKL